MELSIKFFNAKFGAFFLYTKEKEINLYKIYNTNRDIFILLNVNIFI